LGCIACDHRDVLKIYSDADDELIETGLMKSILPTADSVVNSNQSIQTGVFAIRRYNWKAHSKIMSEIQSRV
jgi:uncharacterized membrane protein YozB (DUF420 family)